MEAAIGEEIKHETALGGHHIWISFCLLPYRFFFAESRTGVDLSCDAARAMGRGVEASRLFEDARFIGDWGAG